MRINSQTIIGTTSSTGGVAVSAYNHDTDAISTTDLDSYNSPDDHSNPAIYRRNDDRLLLMWAGHAAQEGADEMRWRITTEPFNISSFGPLNSFGGDGILRDYPWIFEWDGVLRVYFRHRDGGDNTWRYRVSTDDGASWDSTEYGVIDWGDWTYPAIAKHEGSTERLHFATGDHRESVSAIRHWYLEGGTYYGSDGTPIQNEDVELTNANDATKIYDGSGVDGAKIYDLIIDDDGTPYVGFSKHVETGDGGGDGDYRAMWGKWDGSEWITSEVVEMGGSLPEDHYYEAGLSLDPKDPTQMMVSVEAEDRNYQIQEWATDDGVTWSKVQDISPDHGTGTGPTKRGRPIYPRGYHDGDLRELWWAGEYYHYTDFKTSIVTAP